MGNTSSSVTAGVKNQVNSGSKAVYKLANLAGGGELVNLAKIARKTNDFTELDEKIKAEVPRFLYNGGEGAWLSVAQVISTRHKERTGNDLVPVIPNASSQTETLQNKEGTLKEVCWDLTERGAVGETALHVCFLCGTEDHMVLAKRLIEFYPKLINDVYLSDEYYGENVLHMGVVNEDPQIVRFLLHRGASVAQRCSGNFFTCEDQKASRTDSVEHEWVALSKNTRYIGHMYWGEYPLSFAACLSQEECFRLLVAKGASTNWQDTNGNTVMHICVIHENAKMFDLALMLGGDLHLENRLSLTPMTLAAYLAKKEMFAHVADKECEVYWTYGGVRCAAYPLEHLDSIHPELGTINRNSALALAVYGESSEHLSLLPGLLEELVRNKWKTFAQKTLYRQLAMFIAYFFVIFIAFLLRPTQFERKIGSRSLICIRHPHAISDLGHLDLIQAFMHVLALLGALGYLLQMMFDIRNVGKRLYFLSLSGFPAKAIFLVSCVLVVFATALRLACLDDLEDVIWIIFVLLTGAKFLFFCRGFKTVGPFVLMLYKIIIRDLLRFFIIYCVIVIGFSQAFYIIFLRYNPDDPTFDITVNGTIVSNIFESFNRMFIMSLNEFSVFYEQLNDCKLAVLGKITFIVFLVLVSLLLINMLIAMMTNTYEQISSNSLEWLRQWAAIVLMMEQSVHPVKRLEYQNAYSIPMKDRKRCALLLKVRLPEDKVEEQKAERKQQRQAFIEEYSYRRQLRGYEVRNAERAIRKASAVIQTMQTV